MRTRALGGVRLQISTTVINGVRHVHSYIHICSKSNLPAGEFEWNGNAEGPYRSFIMSVCLGATMLSVLPVLVVSLLGRLGSRFRSAHRPARSRSSSSKSMVGPVHVRQALTDLSAGELECFAISAVLD
jgi:hypothetical protein